MEGTCRLRHRLVMVHGRTCRPISHKTSPYASNPCAKSESTPPLGYDDAQIPLPAGAHSCSRGGRGAHRRTASDATPYGMQDSLSSPAARRGLVDVWCRDRHVPWHAWHQEHRTPPLHGTVGATPRVPCPPRGHDSTRALTQTTHRPGVRLLGRSAPHQRLGRPANPAS